MAWLSVILLGGFEARVAGSAPAALPARAQALLARLCLPPGQAHPRDKLAALLWPDAPAARARQSLRQMLLTLRQAFPAGDPPLLTESRDALAANPGAVEVDAVALERLAGIATPAALEEAAGLCRGELVEGIAAQDGPFEEWLLTERERLRELSLQVLSALLRHQVDEGHGAAAIQTAVRLLAHEPAEEAVHRTLMRLYAGQGRRTAALRQYEVCRAALKRELGLEPEARTRQLYRELLQSPGPVGEGEARPAVESSPVRVPDAVLVGRQPELDRLALFRERAWAGHGHVAVIVGEAGIGKTRLVEAAIEDARAHGGHVLIGRSYESTQALPFGPWVDALRNGGVIEALAREPGLGGPFRAELARVLPHLTTGETTAGRGEDRLRLFEALAHVIEETARRAPLLLVIEDAHWADELSVRLLAFVARRLAAWPVLAVVTARDEELAAAPALRHVVAELDRERHTARLSLAPLTREDTVALTGHLARAGRAPAAVEHLADRIWDASAGNPFVAVETVRALDEDGAPGADQPLPLPSRVRDTILARLDRSSDPARELVSVAAVIGRQFDFALAQRAAGLDAAGAALAVEELVARRVLHVVDDRLDFTHDRIREVAYARLLPPRRQLLHAAVAQAIEALHPDRLDELSDRLAHHFAKTDLDGPAIEYLTRFADRAAQAYASAAAADALREALDRARRAAGAEADRRVLALLDKYTLSLAVLGRFREILELLLPERARAERVDDPRLSSAYFFRLGLTYSYLGEPADAATWAARALVDAERGGDDTAAGRARYVLALAAYYTGASTEGVEHARRGIAHLERGPTRVDASWLGQTQWVLGLLLALRGELDAALDAEAAVEATAVRLGGEPRLESFAAWTRGWIHAMRGEFDLGVELCRRSVASAPDPVNAALSAGRLAIALLERGDAAAALPLLEESVGKLARFHFPQIEGLYTALIAEARLAMGDVAAAREAGARAETLTRDGRYPYGLGWARRALAHVARAEGDLDAAATEARAAIDIFAGVEAAFEVARTQLLLAELELARGERAVPAALLTEAAGALGSMGVARYDARVAALRAQASRGAPA